MLELSQIISAYLAGIIDGEGCIALYMPKRESNKSQGGFTFIPQIQVSNTDRQWLEHIGKVSEVKYDIQEKPVGSKLWRSHSYTLRFPPKSVKELLPQIYPFLFVKKVNAEILMLHFNEGPKKEDSGHGKFRADKKFDVSKYLVNLMHRVNTRGRGSTNIKEQAIKEFREFRAAKFSSIGGFNA